MCTTLYFDFCIQCSVLTTLFSVSVCFGLLAYLPIYLSIYLPPMIEII